jgi:hypothetical protein
MPQTSHFRAVALTAFALLVVAACSDDEAAPPPLPEGPPDLQIVSFDAPGAHSPISGSGEGACFPVGQSNPKCTDNPVAASGCGFVVVLKTDQNKQIPLELPDGSQPRFWTFQPPLGCGGAPDCGYALLLVGPTSEPCSARPVANVQQIAAGPVISVDYQDLRSGIGQDFGRKTVRVEFWPGEGVPDKSHCHFAEVDIDFELTCGDAGATDAGPTDGGATDGSRDAALDAPGPESGPADAKADALDAANDARRDATVDGSAPDSSSSDASDASSPNDGSAESG